MSWKGSGNKVIKVSLEEGESYLVKATSSAGGEFEIDAYGGTDNQGYVARDYDGPYSGTTLLNNSSYDPTDKLRVLAKGAWTLQLLPLSSARKWDGKKPLTGKSSDVIIVHAADGFGTSHVAARGDGNFIVYAYDADGSSELVANEIGAWKGDVMFPATADAMLTIQAPDESWTFSALTW